MVDRINADLGGKALTPASKPGEDAFTTPDQAHRSTSTQAV
jgi:hypothetical protein